MPDHLISDRGSTLTYYIIVYKERRRFVVITCTPFICLPLPIHNIILCVVCIGLVESVSDSLIATTIHLGRALKSPSTVHASRVIIIILLYSVPHTSVIRAYYIIILLLPAYIVYYMLYRRGFKIGFMYEYDRRCVYCAIIIFKREIVLTVKVTSFI